MPKDIRRLQPSLSFPQRCVSSHSDSHRPPVGVAELPAFPAVKQPAVTSTLRVADARPNLPRAVGGLPDPEVHRLLFSPVNGPRSGLPATDHHSPSIWGDRISAPARPATGNIAASDKVELKSDCRVVGDIKAPRILIADGASFKGNVDMDAKG